ncbi:hypothetical protein B0H16DRAFT_823553 [Mycena metata]|uniref:Uncharacterized protein n=1 Tax=Mycena metata TaxID=1033252 RepID=A0AAD7N8V1_9AGAR|nr:hypothetical protein B0H16DRAFT_823553 [Mycena metata]
MTPKLITSLTGMVADGFGQMSLYLLSPIPLFISGPLMSLFAWMDQPSNARYPYLFSTIVLPPSVLELNGRQTLIPFSTPKLHPKIQTSLTLRVTTKQTHRHQRSISRPRTTSLQCRRRLQRLRQHHLKKTQKLNGPCNIFVTCIQGFLRYLKVKHLPRRSNLKTVSVKLLLSTQRIIKIWPNGTRSVQMSERRLLQRVGQQMGSGDMLLKTKGRVRRV